MGLVLVLASGFSYAAEAEWVFPLKVAQDMARDEGKILLVAAVADWEEASKVFLNETFKDRAIVRLSKKFILTQVSMLNKDFMKSYKIRRFPTIIFLKREETAWVEVDRLSDDISQRVLLTELKNVLDGKDTYYALNEAVKANPRDKEALLKLAKISLKQERTNWAIEFYKRLVKLEPKREYNLEIDYLKGRRNLEKKDLAMAREDFKAFLKKYPKSKYEEEARFNLINISLVRGEIERAFEEIDVYLNDFPQSKHSPLLIYTIGEHYFVSGYYKNGTEFFIELIKRYPYSTWAAQAQKVLGDLIAWPKRCMELRLKKRVLDVVYVVDDVETYLYYLSKWNESEIFPILFSDSKLTEKFIEAFKPKQVIAATPVRIGDIDDQIVLRALYASWGEEDILAVGSIDREQIRRRLVETKGTPLGIVFTRAFDDEMAGGLALAAARGQILEFLPYSYKYGKAVDFDKKEEIRKQIINLISSWNISYEGLLEGIDFITIACDLAYVYDYNKGPNAGRYALDDAIDRDDNGNRYALCGRLLGPKDMALYQAMCAIFLQPKRALFFNTYAVDSAPWNAYATSDVSRLLGGFIHSQAVEGEGASIDKWNSLMMDGSNYGLIFVNSSGGGSDWSTRSGSGTVEDIPETVPAVVCFTQSGSATDPKNPDTIAGRWLENGAYIYYGAVAEPFVQAFNPPILEVENLLFGHTYSYAFRKQSGAWSSPWRLILIGDPIAYFESVAVERRW